MPSPVTRRGFSRDARRRALAACIAVPAFVAPLTAHAQQAQLTRQAAGVAPLVASLTTEPRPQRERSRAGRIALQFVGASAGAAGVGLVTYLAFQDVGKTRVEGDAGYTRAGNVGYLVGSLAGATLGAQIVGSSMGRRSPLWTTAVGALVGTVPLLILGVDEPYLPIIGIALGWIPQAAGATIGFGAGDRR
jgi:hypothetical protein